ncbi:hypothetical protein BDZ97DRAFT_1901423 [Flammula alnicola]|nr:hypothetical protein BDZ97DRAFT_1901423 [Flammula alnicola]
MARAVRRGVIRVGRKLGVAGARLSTEKKDPTEILEAIIDQAGFVRKLVPSHAVACKLGFMPGPCISTLHSLTPDGGVVAALDFVIVKLYPIAFLEFLEDENGNKQRVGPRNEAEELEVNEKWKGRRYEVEASKLRDEYDKKYARYEGYVDRLERKAGVSSLRRKTVRILLKYNIDALYDELEYPDTAARVIARISPTDAGWLALHIRKQNEKGRELVGEEIEKELKTTCPPRDVRSFRILIAQDARTLRRPANRNAQLTVWDVLGLTLDEGSRAGTFEVGQRFMATNLVPTQQSATRRDTRWTKIKKTQTAL